MKKDKKKEEDIEVLDTKECHCKDECGCDDECNCDSNCHCDDNCKCEDECTCHLDEVQKLEEKVKELEEKLIYSKAELINYRKRKDEETANMLKFANQDLILELLPVIDNFERAMNFADSTNTELKKFLDGFNMLYISIKDIFVKFGVEVIDEADVAFDPNYHQALLVEENKDKEDGIVLEILLKGYKLKGRVIRPAQVKVNKINK